MGEPGSGVRQALRRDSRMQSSLSNLLTQCDKGAVAGRVSEDQGKSPETATRQVHGLRVLRAGRGLSPGEP